MPPRVRIVRKRVSFPDALFRLNNLFLVLARVFWLQPQRYAERARLDELRAEKLKHDMQVNEMRRQKLCNDLVIQDLKIEQLNNELGHPVPPEWEYKGDKMP